MGGFFGAALKKDCVFDIFYGTDYHSHLGTRRAGLAVYDHERGFDRAIHNIESTNFRPKFDDDMLKMKGHLGIGCISDYEPQPLIIRSHLGTYALTTVGRISNAQELIDELYENGFSHFQEMSGGDINPTELAAALIDQGSTIPEGIRYAQSKIRGSLTLLLMTKDGIYAARDRLGRTPVEIGESPDGYCVCFESYSFLNLGYHFHRELGPGEIVFITPEGVESVMPPGDAMRICTFLWIYYGFPASTYEGVNVEAARYECGRRLAKRDAAAGHLDLDCIAGVPDSGLAHAIGYSQVSGVAYERPFVKYTPTWPRSFMPTIQSRRNLIAKMKLLPIHELIQGRKLLMIDDSIVRGTQLRETTEYLYRSGAKEVHIRPACPPLVFSCKYINFSRSTSEQELITRQVMEKLEGTKEFSPELIERYTDPDTPEYAAMVEEIRRQMGFTSLRYHRLDDMLEAVGLEHCKLCTYCWNGKE